MSLETVDPTRVTSIFISIKRPFASFFSGNANMSSKTRRMSIHPVIIIGTLNKRSFVGGRLLFKGRLVCRVSDELLSKER
jgi:hypothetical protein